MPVRLTESAIAKAAREVVENGRRDLADATCPGLRLRLTPAGGKSWVLACRDRLGRMRRFQLGSFPELGISAARDAARTLRTRIRQGGADPIAERRRERAMGEAARAGTGTLAAVLDLYGEKRGNAQKAWGEARKRFNLIFRALMGRPIAMLSKADFQVLADGYHSAPSASFAVRSLRPALKWAAQRGYMSEETCRLHPPAPVKRRRRVLSRQELQAILPVLRGSARPHAAALRFMLLTLTRRQEAASARWRDIDIQTGIWTIPETKNGEPHVIPLSNQAIEVLRSRGPGQASALIFATGSGSALSNWDRETKAMQEASGTSEWTRHDLRRTGATMLGEMGELPDIIEAALNHVSIRSPLALTYNQSRYRPQVAAALQRLADALDGIEAGAGTVIPLRNPEIR
ncbi:MAG: site-specific integrase [Verrucomicrobia bacterium]|nr:site-specific integrase [Verrucomicrobiota bacterium]